MYTLDAKSAMLNYLKNQFLRTWPEPRPGISRTTDLEEDKSYFNPFAAPKRRIIPKTGNFFCCWIVLRAVWGLA